MQIIIVHPRLPRARTLTLRPGWLFGAALLAMLVVSAGAGLLSHAVRAHVQPPPPPVVQAAAAVPVQGPAEAHDEFVRQNIEVLAVRLGELQARLARLDAAGGSVKTAIVMQRRALDRAAAERMLARHGGRLDAALCD